MTPSESYQDSHGISTYSTVENLTGCDIRSVHFGSKWPSGKSGTVQILLPLRADLGYDRHRVGQTSADLFTDPFLIRVDGVLSPPCYTTWRREAQ
jgi:hypothetical protein